MMAARGGDDPVEKRVVLYGVGSPLVVDAEESCARAGIEIVAAPAA
jgi:hypothetical protein